MSWPWFCFISSLYFGLESGEGAQKFVVEVRDLLSFGIFGCKGTPEFLRNQPLLGQLYGLQSCFLASFCVLARAAFLGTPLSMIQRNKPGALESALGGKKTEFEKWDKEIKKKELAGGGGGDEGGGRWFWGLTFETAEILNMLSSSLQAKLESIPKESVYARESAKERVMRKWRSE